MYLSRLFCRSVFFSTVACMSALGAGPEPPRYVTAIHCDPHHAEVLDWASLVSLVSAADSRFFKLTIQFSVQWVPLILPYSPRVDLVAGWHAAGHEISAHHHTIDHAAMWDGYTNDEEGSGLAGYQGDMQDWRSVVSQLQPPGEILRTVSSWDEDFPADIPFQVGGDGGPGVGQAISQPQLKWINEQPGGNITSAALTHGGAWYNTELEAIFEAADSGSIFGIAFHPSDYHPGETGNIDAWFDFLAAQDPGGGRSATVAEILGPYVPEPTTLSLLAVGALLMCRRRERC
ncbi:MAG: PEP-CTERM sorting domain-containing protein [Phycisphaerae bacterium]|nr:PEP-CTERM sorting domain-containing protein [Phycisphaerae bacterium]